MGAVESSNNAGLGSLGVPSLIPTSPLPAIVAEWAALIPLVVHLASTTDDFDCTGELSLQGRLLVSLVPKLGTFAGYSRLLSKGREYVDFASSKGGTSRTVWDVSWGSVFPCANGSAITSIITRLLAGRGSDAGEPKLMPERPLSKDATAGQKEPEPSLNTTGGSSAPRRHQTLHVFQFEKTPPRKQTTISNISASPALDIAMALLLICVSIVLIPLGLYGTAALTLCSALSRLAARLVPVLRPPGYLRSTEPHSACMLLAAHANAVEWHLFLGDRAVVDTLLNKPMFAISSPSSSSSSPTRARIQTAAWVLAFAGWFQLGAMTFVAAQKGWDGVGLLALLLAQRAADVAQHLAGEGVTERWMRREGVRAKVRSFDFRGKMAMLGAVQLVGGGDVTSWMDGILVPHPRRDAFLRSLAGDGPEALKGLSCRDADIVSSILDASRASADVIRGEFHSSQGCEV